MKELLVRAAGIALNRTVATHRETGIWLLGLDEPTNLGASFEVAYDHELVKEGLASIAGTTRFVARCSGCGNIWLAHGEGRCPKCMSAGGDTILFVSLRGDGAQNFDPPEPAPELQRELREYRYQESSILPAKIAHFTVAEALSFASGKPTMAMFALLEDSSVWKRELHHGPREWKLWEPAQ